MVLRVNFELLSTRERGGECKNAIGVSYNAKWNRVLYVCTPAMEGEGGGRHLEARGASVTEEVYKHKA